MIWLDLGQPFRFWKVYFNAQPTSMMAWMVWLYTAYFVLVLVETWFALRADLVTWGRRPGLPGLVGRVLSFGSHDGSEAARERDRRVLRVLGTLGIPLAVAFHGGVGALFGVLGARPYWNTSLHADPVPGRSARLGWRAAHVRRRLLLARSEGGEYRDMVTLLGRMTLGLLAFDLILEWSEISINLYASIPAHAEAFRTVLFGQFWWVFWIGHLALGAALPIALLVLLPPFAKGGRAGRPAGRRNVHRRSPEYRRARPGPPGAGRAGARLHRPAPDLRLRPEPDGVPGRACSWWHSASGCSASAGGCCR